MQAYFPYSHILGLSCQTAQCITRHSYFGEWNICELSLAQSSAPSTVQTQISELYY